MFMMVSTLITYWINLFRKYIFYQIELRIGNVSKCEQQ